MNGRKIDSSVIYMQPNVFYSQSQKTNQCNVTDKPTDHQQLFLKRFERVSKNKRAKSHALARVRSHVSSLHSKPRDDEKKSLSLARMIQGKRRKSQNA